MRGRCAWRGTPSPSRCSSPSSHTKRKAVRSSRTASSDIGEYPPHSPGRTRMLQELVEWESFYVIVGGGAAALIGLQFVVLTLIAEKPLLNAPEAGAAFATPTIVHFSTVLLIAAGFPVPVAGLPPAVTPLGVAGFVG